MPRISSLMSPGSALWFCRTAIDVIPALLRVWEKTHNNEDSDALISSINAIRFAASSIAQEQLDEHSIATGFTPDIETGLLPGSYNEKLKLLAEAVDYLKGKNSNV